IQRIGDSGQRIVDFVRHGGGKLAGSSQLFDPAQSLLVLALIGNIGVRAEPAKNFSASASDGNSAGKEPAVLAVFASQRKGVLPDFAGLPGMLDALDHTVDVVGVLDLLPSPTLHFFQTCASVIEPALVVPEDPAGRVRHPCKL